MIIDISSEEVSVICQNLLLDYDLISGCFSLNIGQQIKLNDISISLDYVDQNQKKDNFSSLHANNSCLMNLPFSNSYGYGRMLMFRIESGQPVAFDLFFYFYEGFSGVEIEVFIHSTQKDALKLEQLFLLQAAKIEVEKKHGFGDWRLLDLGFQSCSPAGCRAISTRANCPVNSLVTDMYCNPSNLAKAKPGNHSLDWMGIFSAPNYRLGLSIGLIDLKERFNQVVVTRPDRRKSFQIDDIIPLDGIVIKPGEVVKSGRLSLLTDDPAHLAEDYFHRSALVMKPRTQPAPISCGCLGTLKSSVDHIDDYRQKAKKLTEKLPLQYWLMETEYLSEVEELKNFVDLTEESLGSKMGNAWPGKIGLQISPFIERKDSQLFKRHPQWFLISSNDVPVDAGLHPSRHEVFCALDTTNPEVQNYLKINFHQLHNQSGFEFFKLGYLYAASLPGKRFDPTCTRAGALRKGLEIIRQAVGQKTLLVGSSVPLGTGIGILDAIDVTPGMGSSWQDIDRRKMTHIRCDSSAESTLFNIGTRLLNQNHWWGIDSGTLALISNDGHFTEEELQSIITLKGIAGGISSFDCSQVSPDDLRIKQAQLLCPPASAIQTTPLNLFAREIPQVYWTRPDESDRILVAVFNWYNSIADIFLPLTQITNTKCHVFDFWKQRYQGIWEGEDIFCFVPAHSTFFLHLTPLTKTPRVVGSTLHITGGLEEIKAETFLEEEKRLQIELSLPGQRTGELYIYLPDPFQIKTAFSSKSLDYTSGLQEVNYSLQDKNIAKLQIQFTHCLNIMVDFATDDNQ